MTGNEDIPNETPDGINTDGKQRLQWESDYTDSRARRGIRIDAFYIGFLLLTALLALILVWCGQAFSLIQSLCVGCSEATFNKYSYFFLGGLLGGTLFGVKYLYKVVARGYWNLDRRLWRILSPLLSASLALVVGALLESGAIGLTIQIKTAPAYLAYGFLTGYFADRAIDKMSEVAETLFGAPGRKDQDKKKK